MEGLPLWSSGSWRDFLYGPVVKNLPSKAGDVGLIPVQETKILHAIGQPIPDSAKNKYFKK